MEKFNTSMEQLAPTIANAKNLREVIESPVGELNWVIVAFGGSIATQVVLAAALRAWFGIAGGILANVLDAGANLTAILMATFAGMIFVNRAKRYTKKFLG